MYLRGSLFPLYQCLPPMQPRTLLLLALAGSVLAASLRPLALAASATAALSASLSTPGKLWSIAALGFVLAAATASLAHFLDACQGPGMIFRPWRRYWYAALWMRGLRSPRTGRRANWRLGLYKIWGGCIYCSSVYVGSFFYATGAAFLAVPFVVAAWAWPLFVGLQYAFIELIYLTQPPSK